ncbi:alpha-glucan family phosphorylase [Ornithobacterium rhinotracheale]|uniref:alpha-glucan family phosphorylase n=1 Tax=Ornithobacterium rhinotracheale TaxID=28251 RepID=UPI00129C8DA5|nr:alpha-glucan family phosphorylase [Ornithobacterium rhinotracheale]MRJ08286.1 alpha-glucan family phosphorylase [Ornithobacterium rhinotracheale]UOH77481.1 alpha-glucan family phosphorylase [Ornithobacterium rhinotracheale]
MNQLPQAFRAPYEFDPKFKKSSVYFCMEFGIDQALKIYSGGLGFLAGSHMRSAYETKQNLIGIGILWKYGYYDQFKKEDRKMGVLFQEKIYHFLKDTNIKFTIKIAGHDVWVKAFYLEPDVFGTAPLFLLSTDLPENDYLAKSTTFRLYDSDPKAKIAQCMVLGLGGAKLLEELNYDPEVYHFNEAHALSAVFNWLPRLGKEKLKEKLVFTTHTPEEAGNEKHNIYELYEMGFFNGLPLDRVRELTGVEGDEFNHSLVALRLTRIANGVSKLHGEVSRHMWEGYEGVCPITHVTNAQNKKYWADKRLNKAKEDNNLDALIKRKKELKAYLFEEVADQNAKLFDPNVLTIVWARRFAEYKRADLITRDIEKFNELMKNTKQPVQLIIAGKPYPMDYNAIRQYDALVELSHGYKNMAVLAGYELNLSKKLKDGADIWLNNPRVTREASGTSGMTAAMNGAINLSTNDGWIREFNEMNPEALYTLPIIDWTLPHFEQDKIDRENLYKILQNEVLPLYYDRPEEWYKKVLISMNTVTPFFDSARMVSEYYTNIYNL